MQEIIALFTVFSPHLPTSTLRQLTQVVFALLAMTGRVTMLNISRWTSQGGSYRTIQRLFNTVLPWSLLYWMFFPHISLILKVSISSQQTKQSNQNLVRRPMVYPVSFLQYTAKRSRGCPS